MAQPQGTHEQIIAQMNMELTAARARIDALANQNRQAAEAIASLRNQNVSSAFGPQNGPRPFAGPFAIPFGAPPPLPNYSRPLFVGTTSQPVPTMTLPPPPPFYNSTMPIPTMSPTMSIPTMPMPTFHHNGDAADSSQCNGFQNSGFVPITTQGVNQDNPVAQRMKMLEEQNERVLSLLAKLPGAAVPVDVEPRTGFQASPFIDEIAMVDVPKKFNIPTFSPKYSGISDPTEHIAQYKQLMWTVSIPHQCQEVPSLSWSINSLNNSPVAARWRNKLVTSTTSFRKPESLSGAILTDSMHK